jgi:hypothetical protein
VAYLSGDPDRGGVHENTHDRRRTGGGTDTGTDRSRDAHLTRDLRCAAGEGITLVGDVTLDLGGHRILGPGRSGDGSVGRGVTVSAGPATVLNGTVQGWSSSG